MAMRNHYVGGRYFQLAKSPVFSPWSQKSDTKYDPLMALSNRPSTTYQQPGWTKRLGLQDEAQGSVQDRPGGMVWPSRHSAGRTAGRRAGRDRVG